MSLIQIVGFNCDLLSFELTRVGVEEENGILAIINSLTRKLNHACDIHKELLSEAKAHSSYMSSLREISIEKWKKASKKPIMVYSIFRFSLQYLQFYWPSGTGKYS